MAASTLHRIGDFVMLAVSWGQQSRNKCVFCLRYLGSTDRVSCRCGAEYALHGRRYQIVRESQ